MSREQYEYQFPFIHIKGKEIILTGHVRLLNLFYRV